MRTILGALLIAVVLIGGPAAVSAHAAPVTTDGYVTVSDGTRLRYHLVRPEASGRFPVVVQYDGYSAGTDPTLGSIPALEQRLLTRGYALLGVSVRGTGCSGGALDLFSRREALDGAQVVEWAAGQRWSDGNVGMAGYSYPAIMALLTAAQRPPHLRAIAASSVFYDLYRDIAYPGGIPNAVFATLFTAQQKEPGVAGLPGALLGGDLECLGNATRSLLTSRLIAAQVLTNPFSDSAFGWAARSPAATASAIEVPVLTVDYWQDEQTGARIGGPLEPDGLYGALDQRRLWAVLSNGHHAFTEVNDPYIDMHVRFFDRYLKAIDNGWAATAHVQLWHETSRTTRRPGWITDFPTRPTVEPVALSLHGDGRLDARSPAAGEPSRSYVYPVPSAPTNPVPGINGDVEALWQLPVAPGGALSYTTPRLMRDAEILGSASADLWISSTAADTDLQATITEVRPDGRETYVQRGWLRASHRTLAASRSTATRPLHTHRAADVEPLTPGQPTLVRLEVMPFGHTFRAGSAIRLIIDSPMTTTGDWGFLITPLPAFNTVLSDAAHPSRLVLGLLPEGRAKTPLPACGQLLNQPCRASGTPAPAGGLTLSGGPRPSSRRERARRGPGRGGAAR